MNSTKNLSNNSNLLMECLKSEKIESGPMYGQFLIDSLNSGQGITIGNLLRRVLLGDLKGTAITGVRIAGVKDEFSLIPGVREDILEILLNLKGIILKSDISTRQFGRLRLHGPAVITASSIQLPPEIEIINPNHYIATISSSHILEIEFKLLYRSPAYEDVNAQISFVLDICLQISHLEVIIYPVHHKVREPWVLPFSFKKAAEKFQAVLTKVVSEHLKAHQR